ncbi:tRNA-dihydrouridine synthase [Patescibacteria group bacterium]|nr:tRNA-dihydrouridine synthase [Patescibacteria group bacterium]
MADVTDAAFRRIIVKYGKPDVLYTEFVSADGLILADEKGREILKKDLLFSDTERPIVAQFFTSKPEIMEKAAALAASLHFDGIDINMGCPDRGIEKQGAGAMLIKNPKLAQDLIAAAKRGAGALPVSIKTRVGYNKNELDEWLPLLLSADPAAVIIHARTRKEMSKVPAHWDLITEAVEIRNRLKSKTLIIGNGDVMNLDEAKQRVVETSADGVMLGRAIFGNPWLFSGHTPTLEEKLSVMVEHTKMFEELLPHKNFAIMKKHYKSYVEDFPGAKELRAELMETRNADEIEDKVNAFLKKKSSVV